MAHIHEEPHYLSGWHAAMGETTVQRYDNSSLFLSTCSHQNHPQLHVKICQGWRETVGSALLQQVAEPFLLRYTVG